MEWVFLAHVPGPLTIPRPSSYLLKICRTKTPIVPFMPFMPFCKSLRICKYLNPIDLDSMEPIYVPAAQVAIQGRVLGVLRKYR
jgi:hypothetical protein